MGMIQISIKFFVKKSYSTGKNAITGIIKDNKL